MLNERIKFLESENIGLARDGSVHLAEYNKRWKRCYSQEAFLIFDAVKIDGLRLYHIGSTSIEGIVSKPIIDILGVVPSLKNLDLKQPNLISLGYEYKGEYGIPGRRYCALYNESKSHGYIHLHIFEEGAPLIGEHLNFRDHLKSSKKWRTAYENEKNKIVFDLNVERSGYSQAKNKIIQKITESIKSTKIEPKK